MLEEQKPSKNTKKSSACARGSKKASQNAKEKNRKLQPNKPCEVCKRAQLCDLCQKQWILSDLEAMANLVQQQKQKQICDQSDTNPSLDNKSQKRRKNRNKPKRKQPTSSTRTTNASNKRIKLKEIDSNSEEESSDNLLEITKMIDKNVERANRLSKNNKIKEEAPTRKSKRTRHAPAKDPENSNIYNLVKSSIYCENDYDLDKFYLGETVDPCLDNKDKLKSSFDSPSIKRKRKTKEKSIEVE
ncbi:unnamed protein product [Moneuplotes crassus]|uniref:Uncharacterized protein n=1 Tax=Euplotes crassus TaxID=5936 RepID=A0AAD1UI99_EUPCR|nr:unnamed protein product [Moneuplotes crassus]